MPRTVRLMTPTRREETAIVATSHFTVTPRGLTVTAEPAFEDWLRFGEQLRAMGAALSWAVGDWLIYGEGRGDWGERYTQALDARIMSYESLRVAAHVSAKFAPATRRLNLTWSHHKAVAKFDDATRDRLLTMAETHNWSVVDLRQHAQTVSHAGRIADMTFPTGTYGLIYADVPWQYEAGTTDDTRIIENQYPTMTHDELLAMAPQIASITGRDCVLAFWSPSPKLDEAMKIIDAWGFTYRTCAVWVKDIMGMGYYFRQRHELLLLATTGHPPVPLPDVRSDSVIESARQDHSRKPERVRELLDEMFPTVPRVELFSRAQHEGWDVWGNQVNLDQPLSDDYATTPTEVLLDASDAVANVSAPPRRPRVRRVSAPETA